MELLITPSMYKAGLSRDLDLTLHNAEDMGEIWSLYVKHLFLAYLNARDIAEYEGREVSDRVLTLADFEAWAYGEGKERFAQFIKDLLLLRTGKTLDELMKDAGGSKKKEKAAWWPPRWLRRGNRGVTSS